MHALGSAVFPLSAADAEEGETDEDARAAAALGTDAASLLITFDHLEKYWGNDERWKVGRLWAGVVVYITSACYGQPP